MNNRRTAEPEAVPDERRALIASLVVQVRPCNLTSMLALKLSEDLLYRMVF